MLGWSSSIQVSELEIGVNSVLNLDGVDNCMDVDSILTTVNALAVESSHEFGGIRCAILLAKPVSSSFNIFTSIQGRLVEAYHRGDSGRKKRPKM